MVGEELDNMWFVFEILEFAVKFGNFVRITCTS